MRGIIFLKMLLKKHNQVWLVSCASFLAFDPSDEKLADGDRAVKVKRKCVKLPLKRIQTTTTHSSVFDMRREIIK